MQGYSIGLPSTGKALLVIRTQQHVKGWKGRIATRKSEVRTPALRHLSESSHHDESQGGSLSNLMGSASVRSGTSNFYILHKVPTGFSKRRIIERNHVLLEVSQATSLWSALHSRKAAHIDSEALHVHAYMRSFSTRGRARSHSMTHSRDSTRISRALCATEKPTPPSLVWTFHVWRPLL